MSIHGKGIRSVAFFQVVILAGFFCLSAWAPEMDAEKGKADNPTSVTSASGEEDTPGVQEQEAPAKVKKKHFPWFWVAAGVVVAGVILYFTVIKKPEYKLTVAVGTGVSGSPTAGIFAYKKGKRVSYSFTLKEGYKNLRVYLDGSAVAAAGEIDMYRHHYLVAAATEELYYDLTVTLGVGVTGTPAAGSYSYKEGTSVAYNYALVDGYTELQVKLDGVPAAASGNVLMDRTHTLEAMAVTWASWNEQYDERGTWSVVDTMVSGEVRNYTISFIRDSNSSYCSGRVNYSVSSDSHCYIRIDNNWSPVKLRWAEWQSDWNQVFMEGAFTSIRSLSGTRLHYGQGGLSDLVSNWTATKISD